MAVIFESHLEDVQGAFEEAIARALEIIGGKAETYAKYLCPVGTEETTGIKGYRGGTLRNSITHAVAGERVSNPEYEAYNEHGRPYSGDVVGGDKGHEVVIGSNVEYAP